MGCTNMKTQDQAHAHTAQCYLVTCMDFRLLDDIVRFMDKEGYNNNYDQFILAGASLGYTQDKFPHWGDSLSDHMGIGQTLHSFREIVFIDHIDCGAYKKFYPEIKNHDDEMKYHKIHMQKARDRLAQKFPKFEFRGYVMDLKGHCTRVEIVETEVKKDFKESDKDNFLAGMEQHAKQQQH